MQAAAEPVAAVTAPVAQVVEPVARAVAAPVAEVAEPVAQVVEPVAKAVAPVVEQVAAPVAGVAAPVAPVAVIAGGAPRGATGSVDAAPGVPAAGGPSGPASGAVALPVDVLPPRSAPQPVPGAAAPAELLALSADGATPSSAGGAPSALTPVDVSRAIERAGVAAAAAASTSSPAVAAFESSSSPGSPLSLPSSVPAVMVGGAAVSAASGWASAGVVALLGLVAVLVPPLARTRLRVPVGLRPPSVLLLAVERPG